MQLVKSAVIASATVIAALLLAGCDSSAFDGPAALSARGEGLTLAVCAPITVVEGYASAGGASERFWQVSGRAELRSDTLVDLDSPPDGLQVEIMEEISPGSGSVLYFYLLAPEVPGMNGDIYATFTVPEGGIPVDTWLQVDGTLTDVPCPDL